MVPRTDRSDSLTEITFRFELLRAIAAGVLETGNQTFLVLFAVSFFGSSPTEKGIIASGVSIGLLLTPIMLRLLHRLRYPVSQIASVVSALGGMSFLLAALSSQSPSYALFSAIGLACYSLNTPISTHIYTENYPSTRRGRLFGQTLMVRIFAGIVFATCSGFFLGGSMERAPLIVGVYGLSLFWSAFCFWQLPSTALQRSDKGGLLKSFSLVFEDRVFGQTLFCWMILGFGNLLMMPLRVQHLSDLKLSPFEIGLLVSIVPSISRMLFSPLWGRLFDWMSFTGVRTAANLCFLISTISFFTGETFLGFILGAIAYGIANAGGEISWNLWVTKFAPPGRASEYMSIHTCLTGVRGVTAPILAFHLAATYSIQETMYLSVALLILSTVFFLPGRRALDSRMR